MKCYICNTEMKMTKITCKGKEIPAFKCPNCNDDYTTIIHVKDVFKGSQNKWIAK